MVHAISAGRKCWLTRELFKLARRRYKMQQHLQFKAVFKSEIKAASIISFNTREVTSFLRDGCTSPKFQTSTRRVYRGLKPNAHPPSGCF